MRISFPDGVCMDDGDCMTDDCRRQNFGAETCRIHNTISDDCIIEGGRLIGCPTRVFNSHDRPAGDVVGPYSYNEGAQPLYDINKRLLGFLFATHPKPPGIPYGTEVWQVEPDGTNAVMLGPASTHGCNISPDQALMVCEQTNGPGGGANIVLQKLAGSSLGSILKPDEYERMLLSRWSPDSKFLVYFSEVGPSRAGSVIYQDVEDLSHLDDPKRHKILADGQIPGTFCSKCGLVGNGNLGSDFPAFSPLLPGEGHPKWLALAVQKELPGQKYKKVLYGISLDQSEPPKEIELPYDVSYPTFSPDGESLAFLSIESASDPRSQVFVVNWKTRKWRQVTHIKEANRQVYNPHWVD